ncbi:unnamed protein product [Leuciscus chuanchicus]
MALLCVAPLILWFLIWDLQWCYVDKPLPMEDLKVGWRRIDSETLVHLYQDGENRAEVQQQDYHDRANCFTDQIQHGNFSLCLDNLTAEAIGNRAEELTGIGGGGGGRLGGISRDGDLELGSPIQHL